MQELNQRFQKHFQNAGRGEPAQSEHSGQPKQNDVRLRNKSDKEAAAGPGKC